MTLAASLFYQLSSVSGRGRRGPAVCPSLLKDPAGRRSLSTTAKTDPVASHTSLKSPVEKTHTHRHTHNSSLMIGSLSYILAHSSVGDYEISVKFNDQHIPDSPYLVPVVAPANDARRLTVTGLQVRHEETPPHTACPALLKGTGAQLHKNMMSGAKIDEL